MSKKDEGIRGWDRRKGSDARWIWSNHVTFFRKTSHNIFPTCTSCWQKHKGFKAHAIHHTVEIGGLQWCSMFSRLLVNYNIYVSLSLPWKCLTSNSLLSYSKCCFKSLKPLAKVFYSFWLLDSPLAPARPLYRNCLPSKQITLWPYKVKRDTCVWGKWRCTLRGNITFWSRRESIHNLL